MRDWDYAGVQRPGGSLGYPESMERYARVTIITCLRTRLNAVGPTNVTDHERPAGTGMAGHPGRCGLPVWGSWVHPADELVEARNSKRWAQPVK